jgi:hypothetical protein
MVRPPHKWSPVCAWPKGLVRPVRLAPRDPGGPTRGAARGSGWRQTSWGYYVPANVDGSVPEQRILEQSVRVPPGGAVTGWAACRLHGATFFDGLLPDGVTPVPVPIATGGPYVRSDDRISVLRDRLAPDDLVLRHGIPCTSPLQGLFDAMRQQDLREAVVSIDMMAAAERASIRRTRDYTSQHAGTAGLPTVCRALDLASEYSRSPNETRTRLIWVLDARLPPPRCNQAVFDLSGRLLGFADLLDEEAGLVGEFDGADHRGAGRHTSDVGREERFRRVGLEVFRVTGLDLQHPERVVDRMRAARARARWEREAVRRWTTRTPAWWEDAPSLDEILDRRDALRDFHRQLERDGLM